VQPTLADFKPNYKVMDVVRAVRGDGAADDAGAAAFRLQPGELDVDLDARLGSGGFAVVYRGAAPRATRQRRSPRSAAQAGSQNVVGDASLR
jgi:hypothetical protein